ASYRVRVPHSMDEFLLTQRALRGSLPRHHLNFLAGLPLQARFGDYFFVHAGIRPGLPLDRQSREQVIWIRDPFLDSEADHGAVIIHGHTIVHEVEWCRNRIGIDTGAYTTGRLTALGAGRRGAAPATDLIACPTGLEFGFPAVYRKPCPSCQSI